MSARSLALASCVAYMATACAPRGAYDRALERWSRGGSLVEFQGLDARLAVDATYLGRDFRRALALQLAQDAHYDAADRDRALADARVAADGAREFYVALATQSVRWGELDRPSSAWRVRLVDDQGREVAPLRIEPIRRLLAADQRYFPYTNPWRQAFRVRFPARAGAPGAEWDVLGPGTRYFILRFAGPLGTVDLRWNERGERDDAAGA